MSLRTRLTLGAALAVSVAIILAAGASYVTVERRLRDQLDQSLEDRASRIARTPTVNELFLRPQTPGPLQGATQLTQIVRDDGATLRPVGQDAIPVNKSDVDIAEAGTGTRFHNVNVGSTHMRVVTFAAGRGFAVQVARPLDDIDGNLHDLRLKLALVGAGGIGLAAALGFVVARTGLRPVQRLTAAAEHVAETQDLRASIDIKARGELGSLARSFNAMLAALDGSRRQQRQLVADASHELRTPLTSLRTNIEVLATQPRMAKAERERLLADLTSELVELSALVDDVVELARTDGMVETDFQEIHLDELLVDAVERAQRHAPEIAFQITALEPALVRGQEQPIRRALANVLDNAAKWSSPGSSVDVSLAGGAVTVRDHGPGIDTGDLPHVFDRFYRATAARPLPGSGLGLAIVRQVMELHSGTAVAQHAPGGGTILRLQFVVVTDPSPGSDDATESLDPRLARLPDEDRGGDRHPRPEATQQDDRAVPEQS